MATYTPNYNLSKPENTDTQSDFISAYCNNMDILDSAISGNVYTAGDGIDITSNVISLEYLTVVNGAVNLVFDDGN